MKQPNYLTIYESPEISVMDIMVEKGFASSLDGLNDGGDFAPMQRPNWD